jgi:hypothetical protein
VTERFGTLSLMGPQARDVLAAVTKANISNAAFPFGHVREIEIAGHAVRALRVTYVGELGWELHIPIDSTGDVFDALMDGGRPRHPPVGYRALESLRLEKGYRAWGSDITPNDNPFEAGLSWAVKLRKNTDFLGRKACEDAAAKPLAKRLVCFTVDAPDAVLLGRETILRDGKPVGYLTSGGYGYTIGQSIGYGYVRNADGVDEDFLSAGSYELVVAMETVPATLHLAPLYDPTGLFLGARDWQRAIVGVAVDEVVAIGAKKAAARQRDPGAVVGDRRSADSDIAVRIDDADALAAIVRCDDAIKEHPRSPCGSADRHETMESRARGDAPRYGDIDDPARARRVGAHTDRVTGELGIIDRHFGVSCARRSDLNPAAAAARAISIVDDKRIDHGHLGRARRVLDLDTMAVCPGATEVADVDILHGQ